MLLSLSCCLPQALPSLVLRTKTLAVTVTLPWDHESNTTFELDYYEPLKSDPSTDVHETTLAEEITPLVMCPEMKG